MLKPLIWNISDQTADDINWPKKLIGASLLYIPDEKMLILIGGNFNLIENLNKNLQINANLLKGIDRNILAFQELETEKIKYINETVYETETKTCDVYAYHLKDKKWVKKFTTGKIPVARAFHRCLNIGEYIFCFGGSILGKRAENLSVCELFVLNIKTFEWKEVVSKNYPTDRTDFTWNKISNSSAILYGGATSPNDVYLDDLWLFEFNSGVDLFSERRKQVYLDCWREIPVYGMETCGRRRAHSSYYINGYLYVFGGIDTYKVNYNSMHRFNTFTNRWEALNSKGKQPKPRCYHEMSIINNSYFFIYGGIYGDLTNILNVYDDKFLYNIEENVWVEAIIGGIPPSPRYGFSMLRLNNLTFHDLNQKSEFMADPTHKNKKSNVSSAINTSQMNDERKKDIKKNNALSELGGILIFGGFNKEGHDTKIYELIQTDVNCKFFWNIRNADFEEGENDDMFLVQAESKINDYIQKINKNELEIGVKETEITVMHNEIDNKKKEIFNNFGFIDDHSQSMEDLIKRLDDKNVLLNNLIKDDEKIINIKQKLRYIMQRKTEKSLEFFCSSQNLFVKLYDTMIKARNANEQEETGKASSLLKESRIDEIKEKYKQKIIKLKNSLGVLSEKEDRIVENINRYKIKDKIEEVFKDCKEFDGSKKM